jgi:hypothetical protein
VQVLYVDRKNYIKGRFGDSVFCTTYTELPPTFVSEICALLGYYAASSDNHLQTYRSHLQDFLTLEDGTDALSRNVGKRLPVDAA